ncbi:MAG: sugar ABC transporter ATP-binding protein [Defluviitaleaceae bacterium]|nr:sugar ABC transporter ATP-binding protein [Defluviitaleaceae bacterium]
MSEETCLLRAQNIVKHFPGVVALDDVTFEVRAGEVHALLGENGAGKSTLAKCFIGIHQPTSGTIILDGKPAEFANTRQALDAGVSMIHQELSPVLSRPIMENIWLGREPRNKLGLVDHKKMYDDTKKLLAAIDMHDDPRTLMSELTVAKIQMIEIAKAVSYDSKLIIMDEPTSSLMDREVDQLFRIIRELTERGIGIIYVSHKMAEIFKISDRFTVLRDGKYIGTRETKESQLKDIINMMVGRDLKDMYSKSVHEKGEPLLEVKNLSSDKAFSDVSFTARRGEILGFAGLMGAGRTEVMETIFGYRRKTGGDIYMRGEKVQIKHTRDAIRRGLAMLTEDRRRTGIFPVLSVKNNMIYASLSNYLNKFGFLKFKEIEKDCTRYKEAIDIRTPNLEQQIQFLSGGNQQKVLVAKWLLTDPDVLILDEPTRGIDVGAKAEIYKLMENLAKEGKCILMVSSELPEILGMSDRIVVMHEGHVTGILENTPDMTEEHIMAYATKSVEKTT